MESSLTPVEKTGMILGCSAPKVECQQLFEDMPLLFLLPSREMEVARDMS